MSAIAEVRPSPIAGRWYSNNPDELRQQVDAYLSSARLPDLQGQVVGVVAPHAGHIYSGETAGYAFASVLGQDRDLVAVISPMHAPYPANLLTSAHLAYGTPLGPVPIDREALAQLDEILTQKGMSLTPVANDKEHSLEIELPFLQRALRNNFKILPIMLSNQQPRVARLLGQALAQVMQERSCLLVASTDLSHHYPEELAQRLDNEMLRIIRSFSPDDLYTAEKMGKGFACGLAAVATTLWAAREMGANMVEILHHSTSAKETGDYSSVVGYGAAAVLKLA